MSGHDQHERFRDAPAPQDFTDAWGLASNSKGSPLGNLANAVTVLQKDPLWGPSRLWYDEFLGRVLIANSPTREWRDDDDAQLTVYMQQAIGMTTIPEAQVASAARLVARQRSRHVVRDWLASLTWDGTERLEHAFEDFWGVETNERQPCEYVRPVSANFFLGLAARVAFPGCQLDNMVIFEGEQGIGKARALRVLGGEWYMLAAESIHNKDFFQALPGKWIVEIGEMESFSRAERERVKLVISTPIDRYRPSHARHARDFPRQCVFAGTSNRDDYGNDDTGLRRFWPVFCGTIDVDGLAAARDQLFAEAWARINAGASWWVTPDRPTKAAQRDRQSEDVWTPLVLDYLDGAVIPPSAPKTEVQIHDILADACKLTPNQMTHITKLRVGSILRLAGWTKTVRRLNGRLAKIWVAPQDE